MACGILVSGLGLNLCPLQWSLNHGTTREGPRTLHLFIPECLSPGSQHGLVEGKTGVTQREALMWGIYMSGIYEAGLVCKANTPDHQTHPHVYTNPDSQAQTHTHVYVCAWCEHLSHTVGRDVLWRRM